MHKLDTAWHIPLLCGDSDLQKSSYLWWVDQLGEPGPPNVRRALSRSNVARSDLHASGLGLEAVPTEWVGQPIESGPPNHVGVASTAKLHWSKAELRLSADGGCVLGDGQSTQMRLYRLCLRHHDRDLGLADRGHPFSALSSPCAGRIVVQAQQRVSSDSGSTSRDFGKYLGSESCA